MSWAEWIAVFTVVALLGGLGVIVRDAINYANKN